MAVTRREARALRAAEDAETTGPTGEPAPSASASVLRALGRGLAFGLLLVSLAVGIAAIVVPAATGSTALTVMTSSMEPSLPPGTMVVVRPTEPDEIGPGDVMTYQLHSGRPTLVTHRVTQQLRAADGSHLWITQGDANTSPDPTPVQEVQVRGTVWYAIPYLGWVTTVVTGEVKALVVPVVVVALFGYAAWTVASTLRDRRRSREGA